MTVLGSLLDKLHRSHPDRAALGGVRRGELADLALGYAAALHHSGLSEGDTVGVAVRPGPHALAVLLAAHRLALRVAVLDPNAGPDVLAARLAVAEPCLVLADGAAQAVAGWAKRIAGRAGLALPELRGLAPVRTVGRRWPGSAPSLGLRTGPVPDRSAVGGDAVVVFTSGTTSRPRAVVHSRASLDAGLRAVTELVAPIPGEPVVGGTFFVVLPALAAGAPVLLPARSPRLLARQLRRLRPQATYLTPPQLRGALAHGTRFHGAVYSGSAPVSAVLLGRVRVAGADRAVGVYALTELFPAAAVEQAEKAAFDGEGDLVGAPLPGVVATVDSAGHDPRSADHVDLELANMTVASDRRPPGAVGQLLLSGPSAADRYLGGPRLHRVATGDVAWLDRGRIVLAGRCKDMVLRGAENIYPGLYEPGLHVPGVSAALLVGVPAEDGDERLVALVEPEPGVAPSVVQAALERPLARMGAARPDAVVFAPVPLAGRSRKPDRAAASQLVAAELAQPLT